MKRRNFILGASTLAATSMIGVSSFSNNHPYDVAIIGAGLAGLNAAQILEDQGLKTTVIEAKPIPPLFFAGEYTAKTDRGMEGAMESGERAVAEVINYLG